MTDARRAQPSRRRFLVQAAAGTGAVLAAAQVPEIVGSAVARDA